MIQFEHVSKHYGDTPILEDLSFTVPDGQFLVLIGPSGCGKTTSLKMINRLLEPDSGRILIDGEDIAQLNPVQLRRRIGYVIQQIGLFPNMTVEQNICVVPKLLNTARRSAPSWPGNIWRWWNSPMSSTPTSTPTNCPAASSSVSAYCGPWRPPRRWC